MQIFKDNTQVNKLDELDQVIILFKMQNKHVSELSKEDCNVIGNLLEELKNLREEQ